MSQSSAPANGVNFPDSVWRALFTRLGDGILDDKTNLTLGYALTKPAGSGNDVQLGTGTASVAGFYHGCAGPEPLTIPAVTSGAARTDVITIRYDPTFTSGVFPCRLYRVAGTPGASAAPAISQDKAGAWDLPLYNITRSAGQALSAATSFDRRQWVGGAAVAVNADVGHGGVPTAPLQPKPGLKTLVTGSGGRFAVTFDTAFPTNCHSVACWVESTNGADATVVKATVSRTGFTAAVKSANGTPFATGVSVDLGYLGWGN